MAFSNQIFIQSGQLLSGEMLISPSKSHLIRAMLFSSLADGESVIENCLLSPDTESMIHAFQAVGVKIEKTEGLMRIVGVAGNLVVPDNVVNAGNSGQVLQFFGALSGLISGTTVITGDASIRHNRSASALLSALNQLGANAFSTKGDDKAPLVIQGAMKAGKITMKGMNSQPISGMLMASQFLKGQTEIFIEEVGESPWIGLTLSWFDRLGLKYFCDEHYSSFLIPGNAKIQGFRYSVPGDLSTMAFPVAAALLTHSSIAIRGIDLSDAQGDKLLLPALEKMGAKFSYDKNLRVLQIHAVDQLHGIELDINNYVDAITILAVIGTQATGETILKNARVARQKECDRIHAICLELRKMGAKIEENEDGLRVYQSRLYGATVDSHYDHRTALSLAIAGLIAQGETCVQNAACIEKTFPNFIESMRTLGAKISSI